MKRSLISETVIDLLFALSSVTFGQSTPVKKKGKAKVTKPTNELSGGDALEGKETAVKQTNNLGGEDDVARTQRSSKTNKSKSKTTGLVSDTPAEVNGSKSVKSKVTAKSPKTKTNAKMSKTGGVSTDVRPANNQKTTNPAPDVDQSKAGSTNETQAKPPAVTNKSRITKGESNVWKYPTIPSQLVVWSVITQQTWGLQTKKDWGFAYDGNNNVVIFPQHNRNLIVADVTCSDIRYKLKAKDIPPTDNYPHIYINWVSCASEQKGLPVMKPTVTIRPEGN
jgi:hypothetical protein